MTTKPFQCVLNKTKCNQNFKNRHANPSFPGIFRYFIYIFEQNALPAERIFSNFDNPNGYILLLSFFLLPV